MVITFTFSALQKEGRIKDDLDAIYHVLADEFMLTVDTEVAFREVDFAVIELASALDTWTRGGVNRGKFEFEPTGYDRPAFQFLSATDDWSIVSSQQVGKRWDVKVPHLESSIKQFMKDLSTACRFLGVDLNALLRRTHKYSEQHGP
jgi:hypothetical protein